MPAAASAEEARPSWAAMVELEGAQGGCDGLIWCGGDVVSDDAENRGREATRLLELMAAEHGLGAGSTEVTSHGWVVRLDESHGG
ncbi:hypothetical protein M0R45_036219 [Rubus argutus]|uniref:Uncharacterized protein n=1 Tax=Rubus argutus TaxID=59490 RepID=A0AAW1VZV4_RUBAR